MKRSRRGFAIVAVEAVGLGVLSLAGLIASRSKGDCGEVCRAARPFLIAAGACCFVALVGLGIAWWLDKSERLLRPDHVVSRIGAGLLAIVSILFLIVILIAGANLD